MGMELTAIEAYMEQTLTGDPLLMATGITGVFSEKAPNQQPTPYVVWTQYGAMDVTTEEGVRIDVQVVYLVRVIDQTRTFSNLQPAADRIDADLHRKTGVALGRTIQACVREIPYAMVEDRGDIQWRHLGGRYRFWVSS